MQVADAVGNTPLVQVRSLTTDADAEVWIKLEGANPTGSPGPGRRVVTVACDSGLKYLQGDLYRTPRP